MEILTSIKSVIDSIKNFLNYFNLKKFNEELDDLRFELNIHREIIGDMELRIKKLTSKKKASSVGRPAGKVKRNNLTGSRP